MSDPINDRPPLSERERIQALLDAGRISQADAELLFGALGDDATYGEEDGAEEPRGGGDAAQGLVTTDSIPTDPLMDTGEESATGNTAVGSAAELGEDAARDLAPQPPDPPEPPTPAIPLPPPPPEATWGAAKSGSAPQEGASRAGVAEDAGVQHWVKLTGGCGDLLVTVDPNLEGLAFTGEGEVERHGRDYHLRTPSDWKGGNWLSKLRKAVGSLEVRLPEGYGLELGLFAGDGTIRGVRALRGKFTGGDLTVEGAEHLDLNVTSGDVTMKVRPVRGEQRLRATSGDVTLTFLAGSDVTVSGKATAGDIDVPRGFSQGRGFGTTELSGVLGAGRARLELRLTAGDVDIRAEDI